MRIYALSLDGQGRGHEALWMAWRTVTHTRMSLSRIGLYARCCKKAARALRADRRPGIAARRPRIPTRWSCAAPSSTTSAYIARVLRGIRAGVVAGSRQCRGAQQHWPSIGFAAESSVMHCAVSSARRVATRPWGTWSAAISVRFSRRSCAASPSWRWSWECWPLSWFRTRGDGFPLVDAARTHRDGHCGADR